MISTVQVKFSAALNWALFNILEHTVHHIEPEIPHYRLAKAQAALKEAFPGQVTQTRISLAGVWRTFAVCKLWDPVGRRWTGYP